MKSIYSKQSHIHTQLTMLLTLIVALLIVLFYFQGSASAQPTVNQSFVDISFTFVAAATPPPATPPPVPGAFTLNAPTTYCSGANSHVSLSWTASPNGPSPSTNSGYFVYVDGVYQYNALYALSLADPVARNPGQTYTYRVEAVTIPGGRTFSNTQTVVARECRSPVVNLTVTTPKGIFGYGGLPVIVRQSDPVTINWCTQYADWIGTFASPARTDWSGARGSCSSQTISTLTEGNYVLGVSAGNVVSTTSVSIQLNILRTPAYIQTTGGDIHTNEEIFITPDNP